MPKWIFSQLATVHVEVEAMGCAKKSIREGRGEVCESVVAGDDEPAPRTV